MASDDARKPTERTASVGSFAIVIVAFEIVWDHVTIDDMRAELDGQDSPRLGASPFAENGPRAKVVAPLGEQSVDGGTEHLRLGNPVFIDDPRGPGLLLFESPYRVQRGLPPHASIVPWAVALEVEQACLHPLAFRCTAARASRDGLDALALAVS